MDRASRWKALSLKGRASTQRDGRRLIVRYEAVPGVGEELRALVAGERECCPFADWRVTHEADQVVLLVEADAEGFAALAELL